MVDQPANSKQAAYRPPRADPVGVDAAAVPGENIAKMLGVPESKDCQVVAGVSAVRLRPVDHSGDLVVFDEDVIRL